MEKLTSIQVDVELWEGAKREGLVLKEVLAHGLREALRKSLNRVESSAEKLAEKTPFCQWKECKNDNVIKPGTTYYKCIYHGLILCYNCAHNFGRREIQVHEAPRCVQDLNDWKDCIYKKCHAPEKEDKVSIVVPLSHMSPSAQISFRKFHPELLQDVNKKENEPVESLPDL